MSKPQRIWTKKYEDQLIEIAEGKYYIVKYKEWIELQEGKYYIWKAEEDKVICSFPICYETCREKFKEQEREFVPVAESTDCLNSFTVFI